MKTVFSLLDSTKGENNGPLEAKSRKVKGGKSNIHLRIRTLAYES